MKFPPSRRLLIAALLVTLSCIASPLKSHAMIEIEGGGFIPEEGEYISDCVWDNWDYIFTGTELITSGGTVTFQLASLGFKYTLSCFFTLYVKPIEFWLHFIGSWRLEMFRRAPEDFRMMTGMMLDRRADLSWLAVKCDELTKAEGWDKLEEQGWAYRDGNVIAEDIEGGFAPIGELRPNPNPAQIETSIAGASLPALTTTPLDPVFTSVAEKLSVEVRTWKDFEKMVNQLAKEGYFKDFGLERGSQYLNLSYHGGRSGAEAIAELEETGVHGVDGFFLDRTTGKCHLLEMKFFSEGGGVLGKYFVGTATIFQASPEWLTKVLWKIREKDAARFAALLEHAEGTTFGKFLEMVAYLQDNAKYITEKLDISERELMHFANLEKIAGYLELHRPDLLPHLAKFFREDLHIGVITKLKGAVTHLGEVRKSMLKFAERFGRNEPAALAEASEAFSHAANIVAKGIAE